MTILVTRTVSFINKPFLCCTYKAIRIRTSLQPFVYHIFKKYLLSEYHLWVIFWENEQSMTNETVRSSNLCTAHTSCQTIDEHIAWPGCHLLLSRAALLHYYCESCFLQNYLFCLYKNLIIYWDAGHSFLFLMSGFVLDANRIFIFLCALDSVLTECDRHGQYFRTCSFFFNYG